MLKNISTICFLYLVSSCASPIEKKPSDINSNTLFPDLNLEEGIEVVTWNIETVSYTHLTQPTNREV